MTTLEDPERLFSDVVVIGAGPAGIAAAVRASESGSQVLLVDANSAAGGQIWKGALASIRDVVAEKWLARLAAANVKILLNAQVISASFNRRWAYVETSDAGFNVRFKRLILASGARELFLPFPGWTLPGVFGLGGLQSFAKSGFSVSGKTVVLAGTGPLLLAVASHLRHLGGTVKLIAEQASKPRIAQFSLSLLRYPGKLGQAFALRASLASVAYRLGCWVEAAEGDGRLRTLHMRQGSHTWCETCDIAGIAYGLTPNLELATLLGCRLSPSGIEVDELQQSSVDGVLCAGECTGVGGVDLAIVEGEIAGYAAAAHPKEARRLLARRNRARRFAASLTRTFALNPALALLPRSDTIVCRCEDITWGRLQNYSSFREAKIQARCGMGPCQGRVCGAALHFLRDWTTDSTRPPALPARVESLAMMQDTDEGLA